MSNDENNQKPFDLDGRDPSTLPFAKQSPLDEKAEEKAERAEKAAYKIALYKKVKEMSEGEWLLTQEILQEIEATEIVKHGEVKLAANKAIDKIKEEIQERYKDDPEVRDLLCESIPNHQRIAQWRKLDGWTEAVWSKLRSCNMFNNENRFKVIDSMYKKAVDGDVQAAKIWLTLSGDYADKMDIHTDKRLEAYREINEILHNNKKKA